MQKKSLEMEKMKMVPIDIDSLTQQGSYPLIVDGKEYTITVTSIKELPKDIGNTHEEEEEYPGLGCLNLKKEISEETLDEVKKSVFKSVKL